MSVGETMQNMNISLSTNAPNVSPNSPFILGTDRSPIPGKLVRKIISHEFIELAELMPKNLDDRAFRREAAASNFRNWSIMCTDLYNYHTAVANLTPSPN